MIIVIATALLLWVAARSFSLFHFLVEIFSAIVSVGIHLAFRSLSSGFRNLCAGVLAIFSWPFHQSGFYGTYGAMCILSSIADSSTSNLTVQLWLIGRCFFAVGALGASLLFDLRLPTPLFFGGIVAPCTIAFAVSLIVVFLGKFPKCWDDASSSLTTFKKDSEFCICGLLLAATAILIFRYFRWRHAIIKQYVKQHRITSASSFARTLPRSWNSQATLHNDVPTVNLQQLAGDISHVLTDVVLLCLSFLLAVASEVSLTLYTKLVSPVTILGHVFKALSCFLLAYATIWSTVQRPFDFLFAEVRYRQEQFRKLLDSVLPPSISARILAGETAIADQVPQATVLFVDICGFTTIASKMDPLSLVSLLDDIFTGLTVVADLWGVQRIKLIGDCFMGVVGLKELAIRHDLTTRRRRHSASLVISLTPSPTPTPGPSEAKSGTLALSPIPSPLTTTAGSSPATPFPIDLTATPFHNIPLSDGMTAPSPLLLARTPASTRALEDAHQAETQMLGPANRPGRRQSGEILSIGAQQVLRAVGFAHGIFNFLARYNAYCAIEPRPMKNRFWDSDLCQSLFSGESQPLSSKISNRRRFGSHNRAAPGGGGTPLPNATLAFYKTALRRMKHRQVTSVVWPRNVKVHLGVATGPLVSGIIGPALMHFDIFGETVNVASRLTTTAPADTIQISKESFELLPEDVQSCFALRQGILLKGKGPTDLFAARRDTLLHKLNPHAVAEALDGSPC
ncbi:hypothetical protein PAPYR_5978 [Paratrimastix pyriformis]|uniref:Guanylate cyclase domain-containing protein n=1 Tax=Paratrimastix pyriformis TaxID=342808 RepID=A0ABQ8ULE2_9EUKA|nr:hypothetical protein PAPYR_5978 [Paratrimastix pyriformis]